MRQFKEDFPSQGGYRRTDPNFSRCPSDRLAQTYCGAINLVSPYNYSANLLTRSRSRETYNDLVKPSPRQLGQETPDCSKVIFTGDRNYSPLLPKCKRKKSQILKHQLRKRSVSTTREKEHQTVVSLQVAQLHHAISSKQKVIYGPITLSETKIRENNHKIDASDGRVQELQEKKIVPLSGKLENSTFEKETTEIIISYHVNAFLAYYKELCNSNPELDYSTMKELIIQVMYNKISILSHMKKLMWPKINSRKSYLYTIDGSISGSENNVIIHLPRGHVSHENESDSDNLSEGREFKSYRDKISSTNSVKIVSPDDDTNSYKAPLMDQPRCDDFSNESKSLEVGSRCVISREVVAGGGIFWNGDSSSVITEPRSSVHSHYLYSERAQVDDIDNNIEDAFCCTSICKMPCKASGIPVYQGNGIRVQKCATSEFETKSVKPLRGNWKPPVRSSFQFCNTCSTGQVQHKDRIGVKGVKSVIVNKVSDNNESIDSVTSPCIKSNTKVHLKSANSRSNRRPVNSLSCQNSKFDSLSRLTNVKKNQTYIRSSSNALSHQRKSTNLLASVAPRRVNSVALQKNLSTKSTANYVHKSISKQYNSNSSINKEGTLTSRHNLSKHSSSDDSFLGVDKSNPEIRNKDRIFYRNLTEKTINATKGQTSLIEHYDRLPRECIIKSVSAISTSNISKSNSETVNRRPKKDQPNYINKNPAKQGRPDFLKSHQNSNTKAVPDTQKKNMNHALNLNGCGKRLNFESTLNQSKKLSQVKGNHKPFRSKDPKKAENIEENPTTIARKYLGQDSETWFSENNEGNSRIQNQEQKVSIEKSPEKANETIKNEANISKTKLIDTLLENLKTEISQQNISFFEDIDSSRLSKVIDSTLLNNLMLDGKILNNQFHAIISTLKKVAESMDYSWQKSEMGNNNFNKHQDVQLSDTKLYEWRRSHSFNNSLGNSNPRNSFSENNSEKHFSILESDKNIRSNELDSSKISSLMRRMTDMTKSQELLNHLEKEYKLLKGDEHSCQSNSHLLNFEVKSLARKFEEICLPSADDSYEVYHNSETQKNSVGLSIQNGFSISTLNKNGPSHSTRKRTKTFALDRKMQKRSVSLPNSFLSLRYNDNCSTTASSLIFPNKRYDENSSNANQLRAKENQVPACVQESKNGDHQPGHTEATRRSSSGLNLTSFISHSDWDLRSAARKSGGGHVFSHSVFQLEKSQVSGTDSHTEFQKNQQTPLSMPFILSPSNNTSEGMFQKFKKSLSLRLTKKISRSEFIEKNLKPDSTAASEMNREGNQSTSSSSHQKTSKSDDTKSNHFRFGHPIFRSSKERKKSKFREIRASKCSSGDSGDSGIEGINLEGDTQKEQFVRRTQSDMSSNKQNAPVKHFDSTHRQSLGRQYSSPQPIKVRPLHRLPNYNSANIMQKQHRIKRSKASTHLWRSVSQPLDLDKSFKAQVSLMKIRINDGGTSTKRQRRPSVDNLLCDENSSEDEGGLSDNDVFRPDVRLYSEEEEDCIIYAEALWDHVSLDNDELVFKAGDQITVIDSSDRDWWWGKIALRSGWFPASFVRLLVNQRDHRSDDDIDNNSLQDQKFSMTSFSYDQIRSNVINEILSTERDYVKHLRDVVEGYLTQVRKRPDMFSEESISAIFGNMEQLYYFHTKFLSGLEKYIEYDEPHKSCIGECFIQNKLKFEIYSEYCNNHPSAVSELQQLYEDKKYVHFFEACRLLQEMIDISLDGFLLTPVQKICKYPLQLQELLKYTRPNHSDFNSVQGAMRAMKEVAHLVNERRRRMECLEKIATWQRMLEGWEGPELLDDSSQLIHQGEVTKGVGGSWPKEVTLFLFDHQIIYCKRDLLKRNTFVYRGRINTDLCEVIDIPDDPLRSATFHNAWKIHSLDKNKTYVFTCKTASEKSRWLDSFKKERDLVVFDEVSGFVVSEKQKKVAKIAARNHYCRPKKPKTPKSHKGTKAMTYAQAKLLVNDIHTNSLPAHASYSKKKGLWFSFGANRKTRNSNRTSKLSLQI